MVDEIQSDEFMKHYMDTCKEQIEKLAKDPELLNQALKPFMQMSQQLMAGGILDVDNMISNNLSNMDINKMINYMKIMIDYTKSNYRELMKKNESQIQELDEVSKKLRNLIKKIIQKIKISKV